MKIFKNQKFLHIIYTYTNLQFYHRVNRIIFFVVSLSFLIDISPYWKTLLTFEENKFFLEAEQKLHNIFFLTFASATYYRNYSSIMNRLSRIIYEKNIFTILSFILISILSSSINSNETFVFFFFFECRKAGKFSIIFIFILIVADYSWPLPVGYKWRAKSRAFNCTPSAPEL